MRDVGYVRVRANESDKQLLSYVPELVVGQQVVIAAARGGFHDLRVEFSNAAALGAFADSEKYENWNLVGGPQEMIIAVPSRLWSST